MSSKAQRQHLIRELLASHEVASQAQLVGLLAERSVEVAQATVCRDLDELGVAKMRTAGRTVYAVLRDDQHYRDPGIDYDRLLVQRNAPRWLAQLRKFGYLEAAS